MNFDFYILIKYLTARRVTSVELLVVTWVLCTIKTPCMYISVWVCVCVCVWGSLMYTGSLKTDLIH